MTTKATKLFLLGIGALGLLLLPRRSSRLPHTTESCPVCLPSKRQRMTDANPNALDSDAD